MCLKKGVLIFNFITSLSRGIELNSAETGASVPAALGYSNISCLVSGLVPKLKSFFTALKVQFQIDFIPRNYSLLKTQLLSEM